MDQLHDFYIPIGCLTVLAFIFIWQVKLLIRYYRRDKHYVD